MLTNIREYKSSFSFLFTKFPPQKDIHAQIKNVQNAILNHPEESKDEAFKEIIEDILDKTESADDAKALDPINDKPLKIVRKFIEGKPIQNPKLAF